MSSRTPHFLVSVLLVLPFAALCLPSPASAAGTVPPPAASCAKGLENLEVGSLDAFDFPDLVVGYAAPNDVNALDIRYPDIGTQRLGEQNFDVPSTHEFGASLATLDINHDGCSELIVGAPDTDRTPASSQVGTVDILFGSGAGLYSSGVEVLTTPSNGDGFGSAVSIATRDEHTSDLWIGAPNRTVEGKAGAGAVYHYVVDQTGQATLAQTITADSTGIDGTVNAGAHFGAVLNAGSLGVDIGAPDDTVDGRAGAGSMTALSIDLTSGDVTTGKYWTQDSAGVPGTAEAGDHFGAAIAGGFSFPVVGVPGEDVGSLKDAGMVQFFISGEPGPGVTQDSPGIPGVVEAGDEFGAAVAVGEAFICQESGDVAIGSPGEDVGKIADAGSVTLMQFPAFIDVPCKAKLLTQGSGGLGGKVEKGDHVGATLSILAGDPDDDEDTVDTLVIGVPDEDIGTVKDAGVVVVYGEGSFGFSANDPNTLARYGSILTMPGGGQEF